MKIRLVVVVNVLVVRVFVYKLETNSALFNLKQPACLHFKTKHSRISLNTNFYGLVFFQKS